jgi:hypothetical protein
MILKSDVTCHFCQYLHAAQRNSVYISQCHEQYSKREWTKMLYTLNVTRQLLGQKIPRPKRLNSLSRFAPE